MTRDQAHSLLNAARLGVPTSSQDITRALHATGDLNPTRFGRHEAPQHIESTVIDQPSASAVCRPVGAWERAVSVCAAASSFDEALQ